ncbi:MAG TPA: selenite/tellurite reduction operon rhodanese-like protein ExtH [Geobacterales bacterium]|nr:selenite/tellurite reduction operon rhodanese-like protein ExtH [Geobacterales bacterium]
MTAWSKGKRQLMVWCAVAVVLVTSLVIWGCGSSSYKTDVTTTQTGVVIDVPTLQQWMDEGKVNARLGKPDRVVILSVATATNFAAKGHIPGAQLLDAGTELYETRYEALTGVASMVPSGAVFDAILKRKGINGNTTIVFTAASGDSLVAVTRAYFTFRYWGFPKERLKFLNGCDDAWDLAGNPLTTEATVIAPSTFSVAQFGGVKDQLRASAGDVLALIDAINADPSLLNTYQIYEARGTTVPRPALANGSYGANDAYLRTYAGGLTSKYKLVPTREALFANMTTSNIPIPNAIKDSATSVAVKLSPTKKTLLACGSGTAASLMFFLFDAVLDYPEGEVVLYDGSTTQWLKYRRDSMLTAGVDPAYADIWAFNYKTPGTSILRVVPKTAQASFTLYTSGFSSAGSYNLFVSGVGLLDPAANQIEVEDWEYVRTQKSTPASGGAGGGSAGGGC